MPRRPILTFLIAVAAAVPAYGVAGAPARKLSCAEVIALVRTEGAAEIATGAQGAERLVRDRSFCAMTEVAELRFVATRDNLECPVGYRCREPEFGDWDWQ